MGNKGASLNAGEKQTARTAHGSWWACLRSVERIARLFAQRPLNPPTRTDLFGSADSRRFIRFAWRKSLALSIYSKFIRRNSAWKRASDRSGSYTGSDFRNTTQSFCSTALCSHSNA
jgi:hypothetical protein